MENNIIPFPKAEKRNLTAASCEEDASALFLGLSGEAKVFPLIAKYDLLRPDETLDPAAVRAQFQEFVTDYYLPLQKGLLNVLFKSILTPLPKLRRLSTNTCGLIEGLRRTRGLSDEQLRAYATIVIALGAEDKRCREPAEFFSTWIRTFTIDDDDLPCLRRSDISK